MPLWGNLDAANNAPKYAPLQVHLSIEDSGSNVANLFSNTTANVFITGKTVGLFGVDTNEEQALAANNGGVSLATGGPVPTHSGWVLRTVGSGGRAGRVFYETLVATGSIASDFEDVAFPNVNISIITQPVAPNVGAANAINIIVGAFAVPNNYIISYYWQVDGGNTVNSWSNVQNSGVYISANGNTSATLSIANNTNVTGNTYRVIIWNSNAYTQISSNTTIVHS